MKLSKKFKQPVFDKELLRKLKKGQPLCNCGTVDEALETAIKITCQEVAGHDCDLWHGTIHHLVLQLVANARFMEKLSYAAAALGLKKDVTLDNLPERVVEGVATILEEQSDMFHTAAQVIIAANEEYIADQINTRVRDAHNLGTSEVQVSA